MKQTGKALLAWDEWGKNPARAAGAVTFNVLTTVFTGGEGAAAAGAGKAGAVAKALSVAGKAGRIIDPMTYVAKGAGAGLSKIGDIAKGLKGIGKIDVPSLPDGSVHLPDGRMLDPHGNIMDSNGIVETTPVPHETVPKLPDHWTVQGQQPAYAGVAHTSDSGIHGGVPHSAGGGIHGGIPHSAGDSVHGGIPHSAGDGIHTGATHAAGGGIHGGIPHSAADGIHGGMPHSGNGIYGGIPHSAGDGIHGGAPTSYEHAPTAGAPHEVPSPAHDVPGHTHDAPATTPHTGGHTPDAAPHGTGHDATPGGHPHDTSHGAGHDGAGHDHHGAGHDGAGHDAVHAGGHGGFPHDGVDAATYDGADAPAAPGHSGADVPGHGAGEPFEYKPLMSGDDFDNLATDAEKHAVAMAELEHGTNPAPSLSNHAGQAYGDTYWNDYLDNLDDGPKDALHTYSGHYYTQINGYLREQIPEVSPHIHQTIDEMDKVMGTRPVPEDIMIIRGTGIDHLGLRSPLEMEGNIYGDGGYTSTALGKTVPPPFDAKPVHMHLRVPKGTPALWIDHISANPGEREMLLARGTQYKVTRVFFNDTDGKYHVYGEVLPRP
jgi:hypothetical protein